VKLTKAPIASEAVRRIDELFEIERSINGCMPDDRLAARREQSRPLVDALETWLREQRDRVSSKSEVAKAINYSLSRWPAFTRFLEDGRICLSNNAAERAVRGVAIGRSNWTFAGSDAGGHKAAAVYTLIETWKLNHSIPKPGLPTSLRNFLIIPQSGSTNCCPGIGKRTKGKAAA
jgi:transposase